MDLAVASMQAVNIIGFMDHIDEVIMVLGESGVFHPDEVSDFYADTRDFTHLQANNIFAEPLTDLRASLSRAKLDLELCDTREYSPGVNELTAYSESVARDIDALTDKVKLCEKRLDEAKKDYITASHFKGLDKELEQALKMKSNAVSKRSLMDMHWLNLISAELKEHLKKWLSSQRANAQTQEQSRIAYSIKLLNN